MTLALLQARMSSSRLPGKVMAPILGEPMIGRQIERLSRARTISRIVVATSIDPSDDALAAYLERLGVAVFRGSLADVLDRMLQAAVSYGAAGEVLRLTADCPLTDPALIDLCTQRHIEAGADLTYAQAGWTWPKGLDVEVCALAALDAAWREASDPYDREHVTSFIHARPERFRLAGAPRRRPLPLRWVVDTPEDLEFVRAAYAALYPANPAFTSADVLRWQRRAEKGVVDDRHTAAA